MVCGTINWKVKSQTNISNNTDNVIKLLTFPVSSVAPLIIHLFGSETTSFPEGVVVTDVDHLVALFYIIFSSNPTDSWMENLCIIFRNSELTFRADLTVKQSAFINNW